MLAENKIGVDVKAYIDGVKVGGITVASATLKAEDNSNISALAGAASLAASLGGTAGVSLSVGVALARNTITSDVEAYVSNATGDGLETTSGVLKIESINTAVINATSIAASLSVGLGGTAGIAISGAGAEATNVILGSTKAYIQDSVIKTAGDVDVDANNRATIDATIVSASFSVAVGGTAGVGASIGVAIARNFIGSSLQDDVQYKYTSDAHPAVLSPDDTVLVNNGARAGLVYDEFTICS